MISDHGLVVPIVLPADGYDDVRDDVIVAARADLGVDVGTPTGWTQELADGSRIPLETVVAPHEGRVTFLPAGTADIADGRALPTGPLGRDAWAVVGKLGPERALIPPEFPVPALWLLEGIDVSAVGPVLDDWLAGRVLGVVPQTQVCHDLTVGPDRGFTPQDTYRTRMLAGTWSEWVGPEVLLGAASAAAGTPNLTIRVFDENWTEIPAAAVVEALATVDPAFMATHPVVTQATGLAANLPVRIHLRFDVWDVEASAGDPKGDVRVLQPEAVRVIDDGTGTELAVSAPSWVDPYTVVETPRSALEGRSFHVEVDFPANTEIHTERGQPWTWPRQGAVATWSTAGWSTKDGTATGSWQQFSGVQLGSPSIPATFWVGTRVRLTIQFEQQQRDGYGTKLGQVVQKRRVAPGHEVSLYAADRSAYDRYVTDEDGEVSGVSFNSSLAGSVVGVAIQRRLERGDIGLILEAGDDPDATGPGLFPDDRFWSEDAREPVLHDPFTSADLAGTVLIDADKDDDSLGNTAHSAAFHALKFALLTHETLGLLRDNSANLPEHHHFHVVLGEGVSGTNTYQPDPSVDDWRTQTFLRSDNWFARSAAVHEYAHAIVRWLSGTVRDTARRNAYQGRIEAMQQQFEDEVAQGGMWHTNPLVTNGGVALTEGLAQMVERFLHSTVELPLLDAPKPPAGRETWERYRVQVWVPTKSGELYDMTPAALSERCGRRIEGVFAGALYEFVNHAINPSDLLVFYLSSDDTERSCKQPAAHLEEWAAGLVDREAGLAQLRRLASWVLVDPIGAVLGSDALGWTGRWPDLTGTRFPTVYDYLRRIADLDPASPTMPPEESFAWLHDNVLVPWNLEQDDGVPGLGLDWTP